jgi:hypothetical protein
MKRRSLLPPILLLLAGCESKGLFEAPSARRSAAPPTAVAEEKPRAPTSSGRDQTMPASATSATATTAAPKSPEGAQTALRFQTFAERADGCQLLGADDQSTYLAPGLGGWRHVLKVSADGVATELRLSEPMAANRVADGWIYGCLGKGIWQKACTVGRARIDDGKVERLAVRGAVLARGIFVVDDRLFTLEVPADGSHTPRFVSGGLKESPGVPNAIEQPHYAAVDRGVVVLTTGGTQSQAKTFVLRGEAAPTVLVANEFVTQPQLDGGWLYFEDDSLQLARISLASGAREVLGPAAEDRRPVQYAVSSRHVIKAEIAEGDQSAKVQLKLLRADKPVD